VTRPVVSSRAGRRPSRSSSPLSPRCPLDSRVTPAPLLRIALLNEAWFPRSAASLIDLSPLKFPLFRSSSQSWSSASAPPLFYSVVQSRVDTRGLDLPSRKRFSACAFWLLLFKERSPLPGFDRAPVLFPRLSPSLSRQCFLEQERNPHTSSHQVTLLL